MTMPENITVEMAMAQANRATELADQLAKALDEARELVIHALGVKDDELKPPILKERGDLERARKMDRRLLEEKYALARMATRLSMRKAEDLEAEKAALTEELEHTQGQRDTAIQRAQAAEDERDALAAHVERLHAKIDECYGDPGRMHLEAGDIRDQGAQTSLARRDARVAADTYRSFRQEFDCYKGEGERIRVDTVRIMLGRWEQKMRREAEEVSQ